MKCTARTAVILFVATALTAACSTSSPSSSEGSESEQTNTAESSPGDVEQQAPLLDGLNVHAHPISTPVPMAQRYFNQGLVLSFGFNHAEAARSFRQAQAYDPGCAMCYWGEALVLGPNYNAGMDDADVPVAWEALQKAQEAVEKRGTPRERAYIDALAERYEPEPRDDRTPLDKAYAKAMKKVAEEYPEDLDASALYAEALMDVHPWDLWKDNGDPKPWTPKILEVLEGVVEQEPNHPLANHLYIHATEASPKPERALPHAKRLEDMVPGAGHLLHMPAHVYIRTGDYHRASEANERAAQSDERYVTQCHADGLYPIAYHPHNYHFLWATTSMEGRAEASIDAARQVRSMVGDEQMRKEGYGTLQHYYSIPYYALVTFGRWDEILEEPKPAEDLLYPTGVWKFARGMAYLRRGELEKARKARKAVEELANDERVKEVTIWDINSTADLLQIGAELLAGEILAAEENYEKAIEHMRRAVELEDGLNYDEPPPWGQPTRRYLGAILLEADRPADAEEAYREDLEEFPENGWSLYGLAESLEAQGEEERAEKVRERFREAWQHADVELTASRF